MSLLVARFVCITCGCACIGFVMIGKSEGGQVTESFDSAPATWVGSGNTTPPQNFGWSNTNNAGGLAAGEAGGIFRRDTLGRYDTSVGSLDPSVDNLDLSGRGRFTDTGGKGNAILGWFDDTTSLDWVPDNYIAVRTDTEDAYIEYAANGNGPFNAQIGSSLGNINSWNFTLCYDPAGNGGDGTITGSVNGGSPVVLNLAAGDKNAMTNLNRFGMLTLFNGNGDEKHVYFDDFSYTANTAPPAHPGDFDSDGDVDGADFVAWQTHFPTASGAMPSDGDADGDGDVDGADFVVWQTNFPFTPSPGVATVPEPISVTFMVFGGLLGLLITRTQQRRRR